VTTASRVRAHCRSGPAAGVIGAAAIGEEAGVHDLVTFDVGRHQYRCVAGRGRQAGLHAIACRRLSGAGADDRHPGDRPPAAAAIGDSTDAGALKVEDRTSAGADPSGRLWPRQKRATTGLTTICCSAGSTRRRCSAGRCRSISRRQGACCRSRWNSGGSAAGNGGRGHLCASPMRAWRAPSARSRTSAATISGRFACLLCGAGPPACGDVARELGIPRVIVPARAGYLSHAASFIPI